MPRTTYPRPSVKGKKESPREIAAAITHLMSVWDSLSVEHDLRED